MYGGFLPSGYFEARGWRCFKFEVKAGHYPICMSWMQMSLGLDVAGYESVVFLLTSLYCGSAKLCKVS